MACLLPTSNPSAATGTPDLPLDPASFQGDILKSKSFSCPTINPGLGGIILPPGLWLSAGSLHLAPGPSLGLPGLWGVQTTPGGAWACFPSSSSGPGGPPPPQGSANRTQPLGSSPFLHPKSGNRNSASSSSPQPRLPGGLLPASASPGTGVGVGRTHSPRCGLPRPKGTRPPYQQQVLPPTSQLYENNHVNDTWALHTGSGSQHKPQSGGLRCPGATGVRF